MDLGKPAAIGKTLRAQLKRVGVADEKAERRAIAAAGRVLKGAIKAQLRRSARTTSSPGEPPARQTGELVNSIGTQWRNKKHRVGTGLIRGRFLEYGTAEILPRPFMRPALASVQDQLGPVAVNELRQGRGTRV